MSSHKEFIRPYQENGFDSVDRHDEKFYRQGLAPYEYHCKREVDLKEHYIAVAKQTLVRERLSRCVKTEGVNQFVNCKELREQYAEICRDRYHGQLFAEGFEPASRQTPGLIVKPPVVDFRTS